MSIEKQLLKLKKEMEDIDKDIQRKEGSLEQLFESLKKDLDMEGSQEKLIKETNKLIKKIDSQSQDNKEKLEELMEEIETKYQEFEEE